MKLTLACAYCAAPMSLKLPDIESKRREVDLGKFTCRACGSVVVLEINSKRIRKGAAMKTKERELAERIAANLVAQRAINAYVGALLFTQSGCTCESEIAAYRDVYGPRHGEYTGHPLSTAWSRDNKRDGGMYPGVPYHRHACPCRGTDEEARIREARP